MMKPLAILGALELQSTSYMVRQIVAGIKTKKQKRPRKELIFSSISMKSSMQISIRTVAAKRKMLCLYMELGIYRLIGWLIGHQTRLLVNLWITQLNIAFMIETTTKGVFVITLEILRLTVSSKTSLCLLATVNGPVLN